MPDLIHTHGHLFGNSLNALATLAPLSYLSLLLIGKRWSQFRL